MSEFIKGMGARPKGPRRSGLKASIWLGCLPTCPRDKDLGRQLSPSLPRETNGNSAERFKLYNDRHFWKETDREQHGKKRVVRLLKNCPWQLCPRDLN